MRNYKNLKNTLRKAVKLVMNSKKYLISQKKRQKLSFTLQLKHYCVNKKNHIAKV